MKISRITIAASAALAAIMWTGCAGDKNATAPEEQPNYVDIKTMTDLSEYFKYSPDRGTVISGHRGGMVTGYPENSIESFEKTLSLMPSFFEIDPRLTADSVIVLMHDAKLDRTTTGKGRVGDYTYKELQQFNLVDREGNVTPYKIPTLEECIAWSQGKCVLNLDIKDVPTKTMTDFLKKQGVANVIYTVWRPDQVLEYLKADPNATFSIWCRQPEELDAYDAAGIPWERVMVGYVGATMDQAKQRLYDGLHERGVMCMISVAPTHDVCLNNDCKVEGYKTEFETFMRPDIVETDYPYLFMRLDQEKAPIERKL
ncbi:MAG: glycerophosphodiester phosphodiesterase family protein [Muribaculaceae bacterium]|nr:glycerophosphodiester phosphodiesterase family protein [Muribaculaceae bacterium]MDE6093903.1 glycerophosphodiester phosphodiesterase family protein [Muribaculaceae bacterium]